MREEETHGLLPRDGTHADPFQRHRRLKRAFEARFVISSGAERTPDRSAGFTAGTAERETMLTAAGALGHGAGRGERGEDTFPGDVTACTRNAGRASRSPADDRTFSRRLSLSLSLGVGCTGCGGRSGAGEGRKRRVGVRDAGMLLTRARVSLRVSFLVSAGGWLEPGDTTGRHSRRPAGICRVSVS